MKSWKYLLDIFEFWLSKVWFSYRFSLQKDGYFSEDAGCHPCPRRYDSDFPWSSPPENLQRKFERKGQKNSERAKLYQGFQGFRGFCQRKIHFPPWSGPSGWNADIDAAEIDAFGHPLRYPKGPDHVALPVGRKGTSAVRNGGPWVEEMPQPRRGEVVVVILSKAPVVLIVIDCHSKYFVIHSLSILLIYFYTLSQRSTYCDTDLYRYHVSGCIWMYLDLSVDCVL